MCEASLNAEVDRGAGVLKWLEGDDDDGGAPQPPIGKVHFHGWHGATLLGLRGGGRIEEERLPQPLITGTRHEEEVVLCNACGKDCKRAVDLRQDEVSSGTTRGIAVRPAGLLQCPHCGCEIREDALGDIALRTSTDEAIRRQAEPRGAVRVISISDALELGPSGEAVYEEVAPGDDGLPDWSNGMPRLQDLARSVTWGPEWAGEMSSLPWDPEACQACGITTATGMAEWHLCRCLSVYCVRCAHGQCVHCPTENIFDGRRKADWHVHHGGIEEAQCPLHQDESSKVQGEEGKGCAGGQPRP